MYRVFVESISNLFNDFDNKSDIRLKSMEPYRLLPNGNMKIDDHVKKLLLYKKMQDYLAYYKANRHLYPQFECLLWTFESRGIEAANNGIATKNEIMEQFKIVNDILKFAYW